MFEKILFGELLIPQEMLRILVAIIGLVATSYFDLFNNKNIPEKLLYLFLGVSLAINFVFFEPDLSIFAIGLSLVVGLAGFLFYRMGQIGLADVFVLVSLILLIPIHPTISEVPFNYPFVFSLLVYSGVVFALYVVFNFATKLIGKKTKPNYIALLILVPFFIFLYMYLSFPIFSAAYLAIVSIIVVSSMFFLLYKNDINKLLVEEVNINKVDEEEVLAIELMPKKHKYERVLTSKEISRLKKLKIKKVWIYANLPPFLPFLTIGFILSIFFANLLVG